MYNEFFIILYNIHVLKIAELDCCQIIILSIYVSSTHAYTSIPRFALREKVTLRSIEAPFFREWMWSSGLGRWT
jgi:hypothetical protein